jgi:hypothetical protein
MKTFKRYSAAKKAANGEPILRVGRGLYIVGITKDEGYLTEIALISGDGSITASVTARHLDRLGNANHAVAGTTCNHPSRPRIWEPVKSTLEIKS